MPKKDKTFKKRPHTLLNEKEEKDLIEYISETFKDYELQLSDHRELMNCIYDTVSTFTEPHTGETQPRFKINKANQILNEVMPKIFAKPPRMKVNPRIDVFYEGDNKKTAEERKELAEKHEMMAKAVQDYLRVFFVKNNVKKKLKLAAKNAAAYGDGYIQIVPKYTIQRTKTETKAGHVVTEKVIEFAPDLDVVSWNELYYDPRFRVMDDMHALIRVKKDVRLQQLYFEKDERGNKKFFNLDKIKKIADTDFTGAEDYSKQMESILGIDGVERKSGINKNKLTLKTFEGYYSFGDAKDERMYEVTTIEDCIIVGIEEITQFSVENIKCFEDLEYFPGTGFIAPIIGLSDEMNYQRNAYALALSKILHPSKLWDPNSGIDPRQLMNDVPNNIIVANQGIAAAQNGMIDLEAPLVPSQYFQSLAYDNSEIKQLSHTSGVGSPTTGQDGVDIATGRRIDFFESNSIIGEVRKNFEEAVERLCYRILNWTADNIKENFIIKDIETQRYLEVNVEVLKDALKRYEITVEQDSSSYDEQVSRRNDAIAQKSIAIEAKNAGLNIDLEPVFKNILSTFDGVNPDTFVAKEDLVMDDMKASLGVGGKITGGGKVEQQVENSPELLVQKVASGKS